MTSVLDKGVFNRLPPTCGAPFEIWGGGCYLPYKNNNDHDDWFEAEAHCQAYGWNVHLAGLEYPQVCLQ